MASISFRQNALSLDDILSEIFGYLKNVDLATCSQVCRTWNSSACRILWSDLPDLVPLLKVAGDLEPESRDDSFTVRFVENSISLGRWDRFQRYASLVRKVSVHISDGTDSNASGPDVIDPRTVQLLSIMAHATQTRIIPKVTTLDIVPYGSLSFENAVFFVVDTLRSLRLDWNKGHWRPLLPVLKRVSYCTHLEGLRIDVDPRVVLEPSLITDIAAMLGHLTALYAINLPTGLILQAPVWGALRSLPLLTSIQATDYHKVNLRTSFRKADRVDHLDLASGFPALTDIQLHLTYREILYLLQKSGPSSLEGLDCKVTHANVEGSITTLMTAIRNCIPSLTFLTLHLDRTNFSLAFENLSPLCDLKNFTCIELYNGGIPSLSDDEFKIIVSSLPKLEVLCICPDAFSLGPPRATLLTMSHVAKYCRSITQVSLCVNANINRLPPHSISMEAFSPSLQTIGFGMSPVDDPAMAARCLSRLFIWSEPKLELCRDGLKRSGRVYDSLLELLYNKADVAWKLTMHKVAEMRPLVDAIRETVDRRGAVLESRIKALESQLADLGVPAKNRDLDDFVEKADHNETNSIDL